MALLLRKIRQGRVKIQGKWYCPSGEFLKYDGRLDGLWYCFGTYSPVEQSGHEKGFVCLWGNEQQFKARTQEEIESCPLGLEVVDGYLPWTWWDEESGDRK